MHNHTPAAIAFIDASLPDLATLQAGLPAELEVHLLDPAQDGLKQIAAVLDGRHDIPALHLITHGAPGQLHLGERRLTSADFSTYANELHAISAALVEDGELLIYGCEVAAGREGRMFIDALTEMTGLKVAAATHKVGALEMGGDWTLDIGIPMAQTLRVTEWGHVLIPDDTAPPRLTNISWSGSTVTLTYDEALSTDNVPAADMYTVKVAGNNVALADTTPVAVNGTTVTLTLASALQGNEKVLVSYADPTMNGTWIKDASGNNNFAEFFSDLAVAPLGGIPAKGNLKVTVLEDGTMVIDRYDGTAWNTQFYDYDDNQTNGDYSSGIGSGNIIEINGATIALGDAAYYAVTTSGQPSAIVTKDGQTITVVWTIDDTIVALPDNDMVIPEGTTVVVTQRITLQSNDSQSVNVEWDIQNNTGGELSNVRLARVVDSYLAGGDTGYGYGDPKAGVVGVIKTVDGIQQKMTIRAVTSPTDMQSGNLDDVFNNAANEPNNATNLPNGLSTDIDTGTLQDNAYGIEWVIPALANGATTTIKAVESFEASSVIPFREDQFGNVELAGGYTDPTPFLLRFDVKNISASPKDTTFTVTGPEGWNAEVMNPYNGTEFGSTYTYEGFENEYSVFVRVTIPAGLNPADYNVILNIDAEGDRSQSTTRVSIDQPTLDLNGSEVGINLTLSLLAGSSDGSTAVAFGADTTYTEHDGDGAAALFISYDPTQMVTGDTFYLNDSALDIPVDGVGMGPADDAGQIWWFSPPPSESEPRGLIFMGGSFAGEPFASELLSKRLTGAQIETLLQSLKFGTTVESPASGTRVFNVSVLEGTDPDNNDITSPVATLTVNVGEALPVPYISGKEKILINEDANGELSINGFTLGNALDADDTSTELTVSITAAHGTLRLGGTTSGITYADGMQNDGTDTSIEFSGTIANLRTQINELRYNPDDDNTADDPLEIKISADGGATWQPYTVDLPGKFYYAPNGHYYEYVSANEITWDDAKAAAEAKTLYGLNGYLATVTSQAENDYITPRLGGNGWMGASDAGIEGTWKWVTGPETGTSFYQGYAEADTNGPEYDGYDPSLNVGAIGGAYENWADGEPNNWERNEDYAHFYSEAGNWNDFAANNWDIAGYIVEYGGSGFGTLQGANLTIVTNLKPVLSGVVAGPVAAGTETDLQATPLRLDTDVTLVEDNHTLNWNGEISNYEKVAGRVDVYFIDSEGYNIGLYGSNDISIVSNGDITVDSDGDISYQGNYIGQVTGGDNGNFRVVFDTSDPVSATAVEKVIESITYSVSDVPVEATKLRYVVTDNTGLSSDPVDLVVNVTAENDSPVLSTATGLLRSNVTPDDWDQAYSMATLSNGSIIVAGASYGDSDVVKLAKYDANGVLDAAFGEDGIVTIALDDGFDEPSIAIDSNGKIIVAGYSDGQIAVVRYTGAGVLDTTFATEESSNVAYINGGDAEIGWAKVAVLADNSIAVSYEYGFEEYDENIDDWVWISDFAVAKLTTIGVLDNNFGTNGIKLVDIASGSGDDAADIIVSGNNIVVTGVANVYDAETDDESNFVALAILDGATGAEIQKTTTGAVNDDPWSAFDFDVEGTAIGKQSDGKIIVAGTADEDGLILARYNTDGTLDTTFGTNGKAAFSVFDEAQDIAIDSNDKILVLNDGDIKVVRINANGQALDNTFGVNGVASVDGSFYPYGSEIKIATDGTIWIVGGDDDGDDGAFNIAKLSANGVPDENFGSKATYTTQGEPVVLDASISVSDAELSDSNVNQSKFAGATLTLARQTTPNTHDVFSAAEGSYLSLSDGEVVYDGTTVGTFTQSDGTLTLTFNSNADEESVNNVMRNIAYENTDETITVATTVNLVWTFSDGNTAAAQGTGGALTSTLTQTVNIAIGEADGGESDTTAPAYQSASINGTTLTLVYDEALKADGLPADSAFTLKVNGSVVPDGISAVAINGQDDKKLDLTLADPVYFGQTVTISYADPTDGDDDSAIQDTAGNDAVSLSEYGVANDTAATTSVTIGSQMQGEQVTLAIGGGLSINNATNSAAPTNLGKSVKMPLGQFDFNITGLQNGGTAQLSMTADADLKQLTYYKWNYLTNKWTNIAKSVSIDTQNNKATVFFDLVDGGAYDADRLANGTIVDPGGVAENKLLPVILENATAVGDVTALNTDSVNGTLSYAITGGADAAKFSINSSTGALSFNSAPNFEAPTDDGDTADNNTYAVTVTVTGSNGGSEVQPLIVTVMNVPEPGDPSVGSNVTAVEATLTVNAPPSSGGDAPSTPPAPTTPTGTTTVDGATVSTGTTTTTDGRTLDVISIAPVTADRHESTGGAATADIPLYFGNSSATVAATTASLPVGVGLTSTGARTPASNEEALANLIQLVKDTAGTAEAQKNNMTGGGEKFLAALEKQADKGPLIVNSIKLTVAAGTTGTPDKPITITGSTEKVALPDGGSGRPVEALVIDTRELPAGTVLDLQNVEFAVIVGDNIVVRGGKGANIIYAGSGSQDIMLGEDDDELHAGDGDDVVGSAAGDDLLFGDAGNDTVFGGEGNDTLSGGAGNDRINGDEGNNTVSYADAARGIKVKLMVQDKAQNTKGAGRDTLENIQNATGSDFKDKLMGDSGDNILTGGLGKDKLMGGAGADTFLFNAVAEGGDKIKDFVSGEDQLAFDGAAFGNLAAGSLAAELFVAGTAAQTADQRFIFDADKKALYFDADGNGSGAAVLIGVVSGATLAATDIVIV